MNYSLDSVVIGNTEYTKDVLGNVLYGYAGSILGFSESVLKGGAGFNEVFIEGDFNPQYMSSFLMTLMIKKLLNWGYNYMKHMATALQKIT